GRALASRGGGRLATRRGRALASRGRRLAASSRAPAGSRTLPDWALTSCRALPGRALAGSGPLRARPLRRGTLRARPLRRGTTLRRGPAGRLAAGLPRRTLPGAAGLAGRVRAAGRAGRTPPGRR